MARSAGRTTPSVWMTPDQLVHPFPGRVVVVDPRITVGRCFRRAAEACSAVHGALSNCRASAILELLLISATPPPEARPCVSCLCGHVVAAPIAGNRCQHTAIDPTPDTRPLLPAALSAGCRQRSRPRRRAPGDGSGQRHADHRAYLDPNGQPVPGARIEVWQCDAHGRYHYVRDGRADLPRDENFQGYGATTNDPTGGYQFLTIRPVPYPGRTPHIHSPSQVAASNGLLRRCTWLVSRATMMIRC